jgi:chromosome segregation ATPase
MPVSFGVVVLGLGLVAAAVLGVCGGAFIHLQSTWGAKLRASEQRLDAQLRQLRRDTEATTARMLHAEAQLAEQAHKVELLRAELEDLRKQDRDAMRHGRTHRASAR